VQYKWMNTKKEESSAHNAAADPTTKVVSRFSPSRAAVGNMINIGRNNERLHLCPRFYLHVNVTIARRGKGRTDH
jgi:hypothetical protein